MDFEKICTIFSMQEPYYGILLSAMHRFPVKEIPTLGVRRSGNVFCLGYNPDFVADKDLDTMMALLKHECIHLAFNHLTIFEDDDVPDEIKTIRNMAADLETNCYIDFSKTKGVEVLMPADFGWDPNLGVMEYYKRLMAMYNQDNNDPSNNKQDDRNKQNGNGKPLPKKLQEKADQSFDDHSMWPDDMTKEEMENIQQAIDDLCEFATEEVEKSCGKLPGEMEGRIKLIREKKKPKPITDWKKHFRRYIGNEFSDQIKKSRKRESMRFPDAAGNRHKRKSHILVAIDTSGSVSMREYNEFFGQIKTMKDVTFHVLECDARIQHEYDFRGTVPQTLHGGGGTSFQPVIDYYNKNRRRFEGLVYFTDGYCGIPRDTPKETLWVVSSKGDHNREKYRINGATVVFIPEPKNNG